MPLLTLAALWVIASAPHDAVAERREVRRTRAAFFVAGGGMILGREALPGFGLVCEAGLVFADRLSASARFSVSFAGAFDLGVTLGADYAISDSLAVGLGVAVKMLAASFVATTLMTPARLSWTPGGRKATDIARSGFVLGLELATGTVVSSTVRRSVQLEVPLLVFTGHVTVGYAVW